LQTQTVFLNVSKGVLAPIKDLQKVFGSDNQIEICRQILQKGELQVGEGERKVQSEELVKDIATIVAEKCINTETQKPFTVGVIEKAMKDAHYSMHPTKTAKQQALGVIKLLKDKKALPIERASMRLQLSVPEKQSSDVKSKLASMVQKIEREHLAGEKVQLEVMIEPAKFRDVNQLIKQDTNGAGTVEILVHAVFPGAENLNIVAKPGDQDDE
jgi:ribosome maturation protein SDO1